MALSLFEPQPYEDNNRTLSEALPRVTVKTA